VATVAWWWTRPDRVPGPRLDVWLKREGPVWGAGVWSVEARRGGEGQPVWSRGDLDETSARDLADELLTRGAPVWTVMYDVY
jgi:hypothetical protein